MAGAKPLSNDQRCLIIQFYTQGQTYKEISFNHKLCRSGDFKVRNFLVNIIF